MKGKTFFTFIYDLYTPQLQKKAVLSHVSLLQFEAICEIAHNIVKNKWFVLDVDIRHKLKKKNRVISVLANKKANSSKKVESHKK